MFRSSAGTITFFNGFLTRQVFPGGYRGSGTWFPAGNSHESSLVYDEIAAILRPYGTGRLGARKVHLEWEIHGSVLFPDRLYKVHATYRKRYHFFLGLFEIRRKFNGRSGDGKLHRCDGILIFAVAQEFPRFVSLLELRRSSLETWKRGARHEARSVFISAA